MTFFACHATFGWLCFNPSNMRLLYRDSILLLLIIVGCRQSYIETYHFRMWFINNFGPTYKYSRALYNQLPFTFTDRCACITAFNCSYLYSRRGVCYRHNGICTAINISSCREKLFPKNNFLNKIIVFKKFLKILKHELAEIRLKF